MIYASDELQNKATVSFEDAKFIVIGANSLADKIRFLLLKNDPFSLHVGSPLEAVAGILEANGIHTELDEEDRSIDEIPEGAVF